MMARKDAEKVWLDYVKAMAGKTNNVALYEELFESLTNAEFDQLMKRAEEEDFILPLYFENLDKDTPTAEFMMDVGTKMGVKWFQRLELTDHITGEKYVTPQEYLIMQLPVRRQVQHLQDKISIPTSDKKRSHLTNQATGESKGSSVTAPELQILADKGLTTVAEELVNGRGGNDKAYRFIMDSINQTGTFNIEAMKDVGGKPKAVTTLKALLLGLNIKSTLKDN